MKESIALSFNFLKLLSQMIFIILRNIFHDITSYKPKFYKRFIFYTKITNKRVFQKQSKYSKKKCFKEFCKNFIFNMSSYTLLLRFDTLTFFHSHVLLLFSYCHGRNFILRLAWSRFPRKSVWSDHDNLLTGVVRHVDAFMLVAWLLLPFSSLSHFLFLFLFADHPLDSSCLLAGREMQRKRAYARAHLVEEPKKSVRARARYITHISSCYVWLR